MRPTLLVVEDERTCRTSSHIQSWCNPMELRGKKYPAEGIDVYYEPRTCIHAAECVHGLPDVFVPDARPWIRRRMLPLSLSPA